MRLGLYTHFDLRQYPLLALQPGLLLGKQLLLLLMPACGKLFNLPGNLRPLGRCLPCGLLGLKLRFLRRCGLQLFGNALPGGFGNHLHGFLTLLPGRFNELAGALHDCQLRCNPALLDLRCQPFRSDTRLRCLRRLHGKFLTPDGLRQQFAFLIEMVLLLRQQLGFDPFTLDGFLPRTLGGFAAFACGNDGLRLTTKALLLRFGSLARLPDMQLRHVLCARHYSITLRFRIGNLLVEGNGSEGFGADFLFRRLERPALFLRTEPGHVHRAHCRLLLFPRSLQGLFVQPACRLGSLSCARLEFNALILRLDGIQLGGHARFDRGDGALSGFDILLGHPEGLPRGLCTFVCRGNFPRFDLQPGICHMRSKQLRLRTLPRKGVAFVSVKESDKPWIVEPVKLLQAAGFTVLSTEGTRAYLAEQGVQVDYVKKVLEGRPHIVDVMKNGGVQLVFNTTEGKQALEDSFEIRRTALMMKVPYYTTSAGALAAAQAIAGAPDEALDVRPLQSYS